MLSGPKALYLCEIHAIIQIIVIWIYGISSIWNGENFIIQRYLVLWMLGGAVINIIVALYYEHIIKKSLKGEKLQRGIKSLAFLEWSPFFTLSNDAMLATHIPMAGTDIKKVKQSFCEVCEKKGYVLFKEYHQEKFDSISFFVKKQHGMVKLFAVIQREIIDYSTAVVLNQMLERLLEEYFGTKCPITRIFFIFCECINEDMYTKVNIETKQLPWRYLLRTYYSFEKQEFIISRQKSKFGRKQYEQMYREFLEMIEEMR